MTKIQTHGVIAKPVMPLALAIVEGCSLVMRSFSGEKDHLKAMMVTALKHTGGTVLLDILQPCVTFNHINTYKWYKARVKPVGDAHDPTDFQSAMRLALTWGDEIPIGVIYRGDRPSFESQQPVLQAGTLVEQFSHAAG